MKKKPLYKKIINSICKILRYTLFLPIRLITKSIKNQKRLRNINEFILKNVTDIRKTVIIFQSLFFDTTGKHFYAGGAERYCLDLADIIRKLGFEPLLIQQSSNGFWINTKNNLKTLGVPYFNLLCSNKLFSQRNRTNKTDRTTERECIRPAFAIFSSMDFLSQKIFDNSIVLSHGITCDNKTVDRRQYRHLKDILKYNNHIASVDTNTISFFRSLFADETKNKHFYYIPNYVDTKTFQPAKRNDDKIKILFPRRLCEYRGYWLCSDVMDDIMQLDQNIEFDFAGFIHDDEIKNDLERLKNKYPNRIHHYLLEPEQMSNVYKNYDISLIPTLHSEGTSLSCLEAQASGNVVIATNIGGLPNLIINDHNGILINPDKNELFDAIKRVVSDKNLRKKLSKNAVNVAQEFNKEKWKNAWTNIFKKFI